MAGHWPLEPGGLGRNPRYSAHKQGVGLLESLRAVSHASKGIFSTLASLFFFFCSLWYAYCIFTQLTSTYRGGSIRQRCPGRIAGCMLRGRGERRHKCLDSDGAGWEGSGAWRTAAGGQKMIGIRVFCAMPGNPFFHRPFFLSHFAEQTPKATVSFFSTLHVRPAWLKKDNTMMMPKRTMEERAKSLGCDGVATILVVS
ncbi:hypothetical protein J3E68DRAFT_414286 [Trichoderma sp. SZMC 28012]